MKKKNYFNNGYFNDTISNTILFVLAYLFVLYVSLSATAFISFTNHLTIPLEIDKIDFDRAVSGNDSVWKSADNVFVIFSFSPLVIFVLGLLALMLTHNIQKETLRVFLFWIVFHCIMRFFGDFMFGHIFGLWGSNLVSDFMGITYPNFYLKLIFITISLVATLALPLMLLPLISSFFNPLSHRADEGVKINFIIPSVLGVLLLFLWFFPSFNISEICISILSVISIIIFSNFIIKRFKFIGLSGEYCFNDRFNIKLGIIPLIISMIILIILKIILTNGVMLRSSGLRRDQLDTIFYSTLLGVLFTSFVLFFGYFIYSNKKKKAKKEKDLEETLENIEKQQMDISFLEGTKWENQGDYSKKAEKYNNKNQE